MPWAASAETSETSNAYFEKLKIILVAEHHNLILKSTGGHEAAIAFDRKTNGACVAGSILSQHVAERCLI